MKAGNDTCNTLLLDLRGNYRRWFLASRPFKILNGSKAREFISSLFVCSVSTSDSA